MDCELCLITLTFSYLCWIYLPWYALGTGLLQLKHIGSHKYSVIDWHSQFFLLCHFQFISYQLISQILVTSPWLCDLPFFTVIHFIPFLVFQYWRSPSPFWRISQFFSGLNLSCGKERDFEPGGKAELQLCPHIPAQKHAAVAWLCSSEGTWGDYCTSWSKLPQHATRCLKKLIQVW